MITIDIPQDTPAGRYSIVPVVTTPAPIPNPPIKPLGPGDIVVDLSRHNQVKDLFPKLKAAGVRGVILRATMGATGVDEKFVEYFELAEQSAFDFVGAYHLFLKESPWKDQANNFLNTLSTRHLSYPHTVDFEPRAGEVVTSTAQVRANFKPLLYELQDRIPFKPIVYTNGSSINRFMFGKETWLSQYPLHTAQYTTALRALIPSPWYESGVSWFAWQYDNGSESWSDRFDLAGLEDVPLDKNRYSGLPFATKE